MLPGSLLPSENKSLGTRLGGGGGIYKKARLDVSVASLDNYTATVDGCSPASNKYYFCLTVLLAVTLDTHHRP